MDAVDVMNVMNVAVRQLWAERPIGPMQMDVRRSATGASATNMDRLAHRPWSNGCAPIASPGGRDAPRPLPTPIRFISLSLCVFSVAPRGWKWQG